MSDLVSLPLTAERLRALLSYNPTTGIFRWLVSNSNCVRVGDIAGSPNQDGYLRIRIDGRLYYCHRLAVLYMTGAWPAHLVDHRFHDVADNRWSEIRPATPNENQQNRRGPKRSNCTGLLGVAKHGSGFRAQFMRDGIVHRLGTFATPELASAARAVALGRLQS